MAQERLQKILAQAGIASRRAAEQLIKDGRVTVDGTVVTELGVKADLGKQRILVDDKPIMAEDLVYVVFHKPRGVVCTMADPEGRPTVAEYMKKVRGRVVPVGRLDFHTSGVLLLSNDGQFAAGLTHPAKGAGKSYVAKVRGALDKDALALWEQPIDIDGKMTAPAKVRRLRIEGDKTWIEVTIREGRNRQIHRIGEAVGNAVLRLARISFASVTAEGLRPGEWRYLSKDELAGLKKSFGVPKKIRPAPPLPNQKAIRRARAKATKGASQRGAYDATPGARPARRKATRKKTTKRVSRDRE